MATSASKWTCSSCLKLSAGKKNTKSPHLSSLSVLNPTCKVQHGRKGQKSARRGPLKVRAVTDVRPPVPPFVRRPPQEVERENVLLNPVLKGNFKPVHREHPLEIECEVLGTLPEDLQGRFLRNGPNPQYQPKKHEEYHWFDGDGMIHSVRFENGRAFYMSKYIRTVGYKEEAAARKPINRGLVGGWGMENSRVLLANALGIRVKDTPWWNGQKNTANNHLVMHAGRLLCLWEAGYPYELNADDLSTKGVCLFDGKLDSNFTAHPRVEPRTGELIFIGYNPVVQPHLHYGVADDQGRIVHKAKIHLRHPFMMHDFAITERYTVLPTFPMYFDLPKIIETRGACKPFKFDKDVQAQIGLMPRFGDQKDIQWFNVQHGFGLHYVNAHEEESTGEDGLPRGGTTVVLTGLRYEQITALNLADPGPDYSEDKESSYLYEWRLHVPSGKVVERRLSEVCCEYPAFDKKLTGAANRFVYTVRSKKQPGPGAGVPMFDALLKHDLETGALAVRPFGHQRYGGEPVFAPSTQRSEAKEDEDRGYLLTHVYDEVSKRCEVLVLDARDVDTSEPLARVMLPARVPYGFHGMFLKA